MDRSATIQNNVIDAGKIDRTELVEIKIPFKSPYYSSSPGYERYYGEVNINGSFYTYVERKVSNDTIYMLCLPDVQKSTLQKAKTTLSSEIAGITGKGEQKDHKTNFKKLSVDYDGFHSGAIAYLPAAQPKISNRLYNSSLACGFASSLLRPPGC